MNTIKSIHVEMPQSQNYYELHDLILNLVQRKASPEEQERIKLGFENLHRDYPEGSDKNLNYLTPEQNTNLMEQYIGNNKIQL